MMNANTNTAQLINEEMVLASLKRDDLDALVVGEVRTKKTMEQEPLLSPAAISRPRFSVHVKPLINGGVVIDIFSVKKAWMPMWLYGQRCFSTMLMVGEHAGNKVFSIWNETSHEDSNSNGLFVESRYPTARATENITTEEVLMQSLTSAVSGPRKAGPLKLIGADIPSEVRDRVRKKIIQSMTQPNAAFSIQFGGIGALLIAALCTLLVVGMLTSKSQQNANSSIANTTKQAHPADSSLTSADADLREQMALSSSIFAQNAFAKLGNIGAREALTLAQKVTLRDTPIGGKTLVVWSDPFCPHCRDLEPTIESLPRNIGITVIPVAFKEGSRLLASYVMCGGDGAERGSRWIGLMKDKPEGQIDKQCSTGPESADLNSTLFLRTNLTNTPTIMSASGEIYAGELSPAAITKWVENVL